jgi:hypothetical protein
METPGLCQESLPWTVTLLTDVSFQRKNYLNKHLVVHCYET